MVDNRKMTQTGQAYVDPNSPLVAEIAHLEADRAAQAERMARLEEALKPFDRYVDEWTDFFDDETPVIDADGEFVAKLGDFRRARALSQEGSDA